MKITFGFIVGNIAKIWTCENFPLYGTSALTYETMPTDQLVANAHKVLRVHIHSHIMEIGQGNSWYTVGDFNDRVVWMTKLLHLLVATF